MCRSGQTAYSRGADSSISDRDGFTPVNNASCCGDLDVIKLFLEMGADGTIPSNNGWTTPRFGSSKGHIEFLKALLATITCDINARGVNGLTVTAWAARKVALISSTRLSRGGRTLRFHICMGQPVFIWQPKRGISRLSKNYSTTAAHGARPIFHGQMLCRLLSLQDIPV